MPVSRYPLAFATSHALDLLFDRLARFVQLLTKLVNGASGAVLDDIKLTHYRPDRHC